MGVQKPSHSCALSYISAIMLLFPIRISLCQVFRRTAKCKPLGRWNLLWKAPSHIELPNARQQQQQPKRQASTCITKKSKLLVDLIRLNPSEEMSTIVHSTRSWAQLCLFFGKTIGTNASLALQGEPTTALPYWSSALDVFKSGYNLPPRTHGSYSHEEN